MGHISRERDMVHTCGHAITEDWVGREQAEALVARPCDVCSMDLPELKGSDKQVAWAKDIRRDAIRKLDERGIGGPEELADAMRQALYQQDEARFWIDNRHWNNVENLLAAAVKNLSDAERERLMDLAG